MNEKALTIEKLDNIFDKLNDPYIAANEKLLQFLENKFKNKLIEMVALRIILWQVEHFYLVNNWKIIVNLNVHTLFKKLCDISYFTKEVNISLDKLEEELKYSSQSFFGQVWFDLYFPVVTIKNTNGKLC